MYLNGNASSSSNNIFVAFYFLSRCFADVNTHGLKKGEQKKLKSLMGCRIKSTRTMFKTKLLICQLKINLADKVSFGKIPHLLDRKIRKLL